MVLQDARRVTADQVTYDRRTGRITVKGAVEFEDPKLRIQSKAGSYDQIGGADFGDAAFQLLNRRGRGVAREIRSSRAAKSARQRHYTTCPAGNEDWTLHASSIKLDTARQRGGAQRLAGVQGRADIVHAVSILPAGEPAPERALVSRASRIPETTATPSRFPYYFNLAPNYDLTLTPGFMSARGVDLDGQFRYLTEKRRTGKSTRRCCRTIRKRTTGTQLFPR